jgi:hypothetical protein
MPVAVIICANSHPNSKRRFYRTSRQLAYELAGVPGKRTPVGAFPGREGSSSEGKKAMIFVRHPLTYGMKRVQPQNLTEEKKEDFRS